MVKTLNRTLTISFFCNFFLYKRFTIRRVSSITANIAFSRSFFKKPLISVSRIGSSGSKFEIVLKTSNLCATRGRSNPTDPNNAAL